MATVVSEPEHESDCVEHQQNLFDGSYPSRINYTQPEVSLVVNQQLPAVLVLTDQLQYDRVESSQVPVCPKIPQDSLFPEPQSSCSLRLGQEKYKPSSLGQDKPLSASVYSILASYSKPDSTFPAITEPKHTIEINHTTGSTPTSAGSSTAPSTGDAVLQNQDESEQKPGKAKNMVAHLVSQSRYSLIACDFCQKPCHRAVTLPCCQVQGCRNHAVMHIVKNKGCWECGTEATTNDLEIAVVLREAVIIVKNGGTLDDAVRENLEERREARKQMADERKRSGGLISTTDVSDEDEKMVEEDFDDIGWREQKETTKDKERVLLAKKMFKNAVAADPNRNLTFHGFRARTRRYRRHLHLQPKSFEIQSGKLVPLPGFKKIETSISGAPFNGDDHNESNEENIDIEEIPEKMKKVFVEQLQLRYRKRYNDKDRNELKMFVDHYVDGFKETSDFFSFYNLGLTRKQISRDRLEEFKNMENLIGSFPEFYGKTEKTFCKKCRVAHRF